VPALNALKGNLQPALAFTLHCTGCDAPNCPVSLKLTHKTILPRRGTSVAKWGQELTKQPTTENRMLSWSIIFLVVALIAAFLGFAGIAGTAAWIAKVLFVVFLVLFLVSLIFGRRVR
jgi:uncharacterized membrane protein YtjA (UPF0391 family)